MALINEYIEMYKSLDETNDYSKRSAALKSTIDVANKKKSKLLGFNASGELSDKDFLAMNKQCSEEIELAERELYEIEQERCSKAEFVQHIEKIRSVLKQAEKDAEQGLINKDFVEKYIDKIFITPEDGQARLEIKIFTGETTSKYLQNLRGRTGHTFKKMVQAYEAGK